ncbi:hypothetical protein KA082_02010, partial [Candidatus Woesebacteria bacterium]|nr:hypothetical protein [Candidatus Woesebacteria bacterium]
MHQKPFKAFGHRAKVSVLTIMFVSVILHLSVSLCYSVESMQQSSNHISNYVIAFSLLVLIVCGGFLARTGRLGNGPWVSTPSTPEQPQNIPTVDSTTEQPLPTEAPLQASTTDWPSYTYSDPLSGIATFTLQLPPTWYFDTSVITNYDSATRTTKEGYPEGGIKCDLRPEEPAATQPGSVQTLFDEAGVTLTKAQLVDDQTVANPGLGAGVLFTYTDPAHKPYT